MNYDDVVAQLRHAWLGTDGRTRWVPIDPTPWSYDTYPTSGASRVATRTTLSPGMLVRVCRAPGTLQPRWEFGIVTDQMIKKWDGDKDLYVIMWANAGMLTEAYTHEPSDGVVFVEEM